MSNAFDIVKACKKYGVKTIDDLVKILWDSIQEDEQQILQLKAENERRT